MFKTLLMLTLCSALLLAACAADDPAVPLTDGPDGPDELSDGEGGADAVDQPCALTDQPFPRPEPDYTGKLARDFSPFAAALEAYGPDEAAERTSLVAGKTIPELQALLAGGQLTSADLVVYYLERIQRYDIDRLNAVLELNPDALLIAQALDDERVAGGVRGPLHGIPVLLKDNIATGDRPHTAAGAAALLGWSPSRDAFAAGQLRQAGAIFLGKTNLSEWANYMDPCLPNGFSANGGQTRNPYGPFETSGSSSGSAVAAAADLATVAVGSETQGSIIAPAGINSVVGLKPTKGLISGDLVIPLLPFQDTLGPIGRSVTDVAILLGAMTGEDANDPATAATAELAGADFTAFLSADALANVRVGVPVWNEAAFESLFAESNLSAEQQAALRPPLEEENTQLRAVGDILTAAGVTVVEIPITAISALSTDPEPLLEYGFRAALDSFLDELGPEAPVASLAEIIAFNSADLPNRAPYGQGSLERSQNTTMTADEFAARRDAAMSDARRQLDAIFDTYGVDVIASTAQQAYAPAGYPALTVPSGYEADGTPTGQVFVGRWLGEPQLLAVGYAYEQATNVFVPPDLARTIGQP